MTPDGQSHAKATSCCHNGGKVTDKMRRNHMARLDDSQYSPELSPCDLWLLGVVKNRMKVNQFKNVNEVEDSVRNFWIKATLEEAQLVFR
jgi:hexokinase